jgi:DNA-binding MarR family transcriptional regulator
MSGQLEKLGLLIKRVNARNHRSLDERLSRLGISLVQWNAVREIERNPERTAHALAELTFNSDQAFGTLITRLQRLGFVERKNSKGRAIHHVLTARGKQMLDKGYEIYLEFLSLAFAQLTQRERSVLLDLMTKLVLRPADELYWGDEPPLARRQRGGKVGQMS